MSTRYGLGEIVPEEGHSFEKKRNVFTASTTDELPQLSTVTPVYKLDALEMATWPSKKDPNPILGRRCHLPSPNHFTTFESRVVFRIPRLISCSMSVRQRAARVRVQGDSKPKGAGGHYKLSEVKKKATVNPVQRDIQVLDFIIETREFANPRCVHCDLFCASLGLALLDGRSVSVATSTLLTRVTW